jgi:tetratricopeptide (TPR) repeat protein
LSAYYNRTGDADRALEHAKKALELDPKSDRAWFFKAKGDERQGRLGEAVDSLNQAISLNPKSSSYYYVQAGLYRRLGKAEESEKALESFRRLEGEATELEKMRRREYRSTALTPEPKG